MSPAIWPVLIALALWLIVRLTGNETHAIDGILFVFAVLGTLGVILYNRRK